MVSDGKEFRIYVPPKNKFILGRNDQEIKGRKDVPINLRPQHIFQALLIEPINIAPGGTFSCWKRSSKASTSIMCWPSLARQRKGLVPCIRKIWIDRFDLRLVRQKLYEEGRVVSDISYLEFKNFDGREYPSSD